ncbi:MAG: hypothetical protein UR69_C0002G0014 [Candidatus Moranbacteria bacterium GW2011_GWE2_35_2-]|nr:MAG: hypothetical protein UR69_C0002G0014 [Candidatus Moranbacteria bacterium GW2011_GWE2_35_2-]KKQ05510.1 MAG: hypothetical protein US15_C0028G0006 [Candidatus Moranbacteria bacterium GW2011_GWF1_36_4]KKQ22638.1 MAG: hypothetical protein US37_C0002G0263 [Candidatus Moranbacteria bacterium GW2011_GWF2_37_11]KKQ29040.1 MAG: hypothetical protein US44_C0004G0084 [Candidatus Moranbacteria bacterium GW2011_GWD1_37_17]KKQ30424.1 MAG: hypothetical protein US47_C0002G0014 [Candidatus Moranbacteria b
MHPIINYFVHQGVPLETVILILMFPIIATIIAFFRQVFGIKAFGIYTPMIVTLAFMAMRINNNNGFSGVKYGTIIFISVIIAGMIARYLLKKLRLLYLPRVAITLTIVSFAILAILVFGGSLQRTGLASVSIFPLLIMIAIVEKFVATQIEKGNRTAVLLALETLMISLVCFYLVGLNIIINMIIYHPWVVLLTIPINFFLGKWTGLRFSEYYRFREVFKGM